MSVVQPYLEARALLGVSLEASHSDVKNAYRRLVVEHPPDIDPEGFRRIRDAYELLTDAGARAREILLRPAPAVAPPSPLDADSHAAARGATAMALLRAIAARIDLNVLLGDTVVPGERRS
jgi:curved DNA-binding protein CbpA